MSDAQQPQYVVTLVHGTFAPRSPWTLAGSYFRESLSQQLGCDVKFIRFQWGGANDPEKRLRASHLLQRRLRMNQTRWPAAAHVVIAHSHGGNIVNLALRDEQLAARISSVVSVSTPFLNYKNRQWIGQLVESSIHSSGPLGWFLDATGLRQVLVKLNTDIDELQRRTLTYTGLSRTAPRWLALLAHGDEAALSLRSINFIGKLSLFLTKPAVIIIIGALLLVHLFSIGLPFIAYIVGLDGLPLFERLLRILVQIFPLQIQGLVFLIGLIPVLIHAGVIVRIYLQAFGGTLAQAAAWKVRVSSTPLVQENMLSFIRLKISNLLKSQGFVRRLKHLLRFGLLHGIVFADKKSIQEIAQFISKSASQPLPTVVYTNETVDSLESINSLRGQSFTPQGASNTCLEVEDLDSSDIGSVPRINSISLSSDDLKWRVEAMECYKKTKNNLPMFPCPGNLLPEELSPDFAWYIYVEESRAAYLFDLDDLKEEEEPSQFIFTILMLVIWIPVALIFEDWIIFSGSTSISILKTLSLFIPIWLLVGFLMEEPGTKWILKERSIELPDDVWELLDSASKDSAEGK